MTLALVLASGCGLLPARHEAPVTFAPAEVETTVVRFSDALALGDSDALRSLVSPDFVLQEDGVTYDLATSVAAIRDALRDGAVSRRASQFRTRVMREVAWTSYHVDGVLHTGADSIPHWR
jgi:hypothetical protein